MSLRSRLTRTARLLLGRAGLDIVRTGRARLQPNAPFTRQLVTRRLLDTFHVLDIGCSGGIDPAFRALGPALRAVGVDVVMSEISRLQAKAAPGERYVPARLHIDPTTLPRNSPWSRLSTAWAMSHKARPAADGIIDNNWHEHELVDESEACDLDTLCKREHIRDVDFLKIDIDGGDYSVLVQAQRLIREAPIVAVQVEVNFHGDARSPHHSFHYTDRLLRDLGFELFSLTTRRYSASALPAPFEFRHYGSTEFGRVLQGDALYLRDVIMAAAEPLATRKYLALAAAAELCGIPDYAAEIVTGRPDAFGTSRELLDHLVPRLDGSAATYAEHTKQFFNAPECFFPRR